MKENSEPEYICGYADEYCEPEYVHNYTEEELLEILSQSEYGVEEPQELTDEDIEHMERYNRLWNSIYYTMEEFKGLTEEEQDFFMLAASTVIKQRDPDYDIYADEEVKKSLGESDVDQRLKSMEEMLKQLMNVKTAPHEQQGIEAKRHLTVDEFAKKYNIGKSQQQILRGKGLPYRQLKENGKVTYITNEVEKWFENNRV
jgi:hypothetical protein